MSEQEKDEKSSQGEVGPSIVLGLVGAVVVLLLLAGAIWGVGKIISKIRENGDDTKEEQVVAEEDNQDGEVTEDTESPEKSDEGDINGDGATDEGSEEGESVDEGDTNPEEESEDSSDSSDTTEEGDSSGEEGESTPSGSFVGKWIATDYQTGDIAGDKHTVVWGDTLWEISEARYGSGFEWGKIRDANFDIIGYLPNGSHALIIPGQVLTLP